MRRRVRKAAENRVIEIDQVSCVVVPDRESARRLILLRHSGPLDGAGLVRWGARERARFTRRQGDRSDPTLDVYEFVAGYGGLDDAHVEAMRDMPFTTLQRMIADVIVRRALGIEVHAGRVLTALGRDEVIKGVRKLVLDALDNDKQFNSRTMNDTDRRKKYIEK